MNREGEAARAHFEFQLKHRHELIMKAMPGELETPATALAVGGAFVSLYFEDTALEEVLRPEISDCETEEEAEAS